MHVPAPLTALRSVFICCLLTLPLALPGADLSEARTLMNSKRIPEAKPLLEKIVAAEPENSEAQLLLGRCLMRMSKSEEAVVVLEKAVALAPKSAEPLVDYGLACFEEARKKSSIGMARKGRSSLETALEIDPKNKIAHEALLGFFSGAPWIVGGSMSKAYEHAEALRTLDPNRGLLLLVGLKNKEKKYTDSFNLCTEVLKEKPEDYQALYELGRTAAISGERKTEGLASLDKCLKLTPPPSAPGYAGVHYRMGLILVSKGDMGEAKVHFEEALKIEPGNKLVSEAMSKLK